MHVVEASQTETADQNQQQRQSTRRIASVKALQQPGQDQPHGEQAQADGVELVGPDGLLADITKLVLEAGLEVEMTDHIGYEKHAAVGRNGENSRNGTRAKTVLTDVGTGGDRRAPRSRRHLRAEDGEETPTAPDRCR